MTTTKDLDEIRRRYKADHNAITKIYGYYINSEHEIITDFAAPLATMALDETDKYLALFKKVLSGTIGKQILPVEFSTKYVHENESYALLAKLRDEDMKKETTRSDLIDKIVSVLPYDAGNHLILLAVDAYDIPSSDDGGDSDAVYKYIICAVCQIKDSKAQLGYDAAEKTFRDLGSKQIVAKPIFGFTFPGYTERAMDICSAITYNGCQEYSELIQAVFSTTPPATADEQKEAFAEALNAGLGDNATLEDLIEINKQVQFHVADLKSDGEKEIPAVGAEDIIQIISNSPYVSINDNAFRETYETKLGAEAKSSVENIASIGSTTITLTGVKITVDSDHLHCVRTEKIHGKNCVIIETDGNAEINGIGAKVM